MLSRQRIVLRTLTEAGPKLDRLALVKLLFLLSEEHPDLPRAARHEFVPYRRGPYSFTLTHDLSALQRDGLLVEGLNDVSVTTLGQSEAMALAPGLVTAINAVAKRHAEKSTAALIDHVYDTYPWFSVNSEWTRRRALERPTAEIAVYTTSYEGVSLDGLLNRLLRAGIRRLIDVRANPVARRFGFHKSTLARICPQLGLDYVHVPEVGVPSAWRTELDSAKCYHDLFVRYSAEVLPSQEPAMKQLERMLRDVPSVMMCKEADPRCCHRTTLGEELARRLGLPIHDLGKEIEDGLFQA